MVTKDGLSFFLKNKNKIVFPFQFRHGLNLISLNYIKIMGSIPKLVYNCKFHHNLMQLGILFDGLILFRVIYTSFL